MVKKKPFTHVVKGPQARKALTSPIRMEILGQFTSPGGMSIAEVAARMGRPPGSLYYHFEVLEKAGLLQRVGVRPQGKRTEALFEPVARRIEFALEKSQPSSGADARKALEAAFRMAARDFADALESGSYRRSGPQRNVSAGRMHCRLTSAALAELNKHLKAIETLMERESRRPEVPTDAIHFVSLTLALMPLRGREADGD